MLKDCIVHGQVQEPTYLGTNHFSLALLLLYMTANQIMGIAPYLLSMSCQPLLPSLAIPGLPSLPELPTLDKEEAYFSKVRHIVMWL